jgi:hypothetical protein
VLVNVTVLKLVPEQMVCGADENATVGAGLMVTMTLKGVPGQEKVVDGVTE